MASVTQATRAASFQDEPLRMEEILMAALLNRQPGCGKWQERSYQDGQELVISTATWWQSRCAE